MNVKCSWGRLKKGKHQDDTNTIDLCSLKIMSIHFICISFPWCFANLYFMVLDRINALLFDKHFYYILPNSSIEAYKNWYFSLY